MIDFYIRINTYYFIIQLVTLQRFEQFKSLPYYIEGKILTMAFNSLWLLIAQINFATFCTLY